MGGAGGSPCSSYLSLSPQQLLSLPVAEDVIENAFEDLAVLLVGEQGASDGLVGAENGVGGCLGQVGTESLFTAVVGDNRKTQLLTSFG